MNYRLKMQSPTAVTIIALLPGCRGEMPPKALLRVAFPHDDPREVEVPLGIGRSALRRCLAQAGCIAKFAEQTKLLAMIVEFASEASEITGLFGERYEPPCP
jgi:hypothetical protein